jgi:hypothetical protein
MFKIIERNAWRGFFIIAAIVSFIVLVLFAIISVLSERYDWFRETVAIGSWDSAGAGLGLIFSIPIALSGSVVAIVLAQRAVDISKKQEFLASMSIVDPLLNQAEEYFFRHAQNVERILDIVFPAMKSIYDSLHHHHRDGLEDDEFSDHKRALLNKLMQDHAPELHQAIATLKSHYRESNRHPILQGALAREYNQLRKVGKSCTEATKTGYLANYPNHDEGETGLAPIQRLADTIPDFKGFQFLNAVRAYASGEIRMVGFGYPFERLGRPPSSSEIGQVMQFLGVLLDDDCEPGSYKRIPFFHGAATLIDLISITPSRDVLILEIEENLSQMGVRSDAMLSYVKHRLGTYDPNLYYLPNTIRLRDVIVNHGIRPRNYFENLTNNSVRSHRQPMGDDFAEDDMD